MAAAKKKPALSIVGNDQPKRGELRVVGFDKLFLSDSNVRKKEPSPEGIIQLASLIRSQQGVVQNLVVYPEIVDGAETGRYGVTGGGRRYRAVELLVKQGEFKSNHPMPVQVYAESDATELSIVENSGREQMHPADEFEAFKKLVDEGKPVADIAAMYSVPDNLVLRRLKLANIAPRFIEMYRADQIQMQQLEALAITCDHEKQIQAWDSLPANNRQPSMLKNVLTQEKYHLYRSNLGKAVANIYRQRGGAIEADLFGQETDIYAVDADLVLQIANEMLDEAKSKYGNQGAWVDTHLELDYSTINSYGAAARYAREITQEEAAELERLNSRSTELEEALELIEKEIDATNDIEDEDEAEKASEEASKRYDQVESELGNITEQIALLQASFELPKDFHAPFAGTLIGIVDGELVIYRNKIRPDDKKAAAQAALASTQKSSDAAHSNSSDVSKANEPAYTERLTRQLSAQRTLAIAVEVLRHPQTAKRLLVAKMAVEVMDLYCWDSGMGISIRTPDMHEVIDAIKEDQAYIEFNAALEKWRAKLGPQNDRTFLSVFESVKQLNESDLDELLAVLTAASLDAMCSQNSKPENLLFSLVAKETNMDINNWFNPTADNFYSLLKKDVILDILKPNTSADVIQRLCSVKKGDLAKEAETIMQGKGYLPALMNPSI